MKPLSLIIFRKLSRHSALESDEVTELEDLQVSTKICEAGEDLVRQGDTPTHAVVVLEGMVSRYHTMANGSRQYLSFHILGDFPDAQGLFLDVMDHSVCSMGKAEIGLISHNQLLGAFRRKPLLADVFWRETLVDAAIFRQAITNNGKRPPLARLAHFFCEQFFRAKAAELATRNRCALPISQQQLADTLGVSLVSITRSLRRLRAMNLVAFRNRTLSILDWQKLTEFAHFDASYLHLKNQSELWRDIGT